MDRYLAFICYGPFDIQSKLNEHSINGYVLALVEIVSTDATNDNNNAYLVIMEHQPIQPPLSQLDKKFPPFNVRSKKEEKGKTNDANS